MIPQPQLRRADIFASVFFLLLGITVVAAASRMPMSGVYGGSAIHWYTSPAFFPLIIGSFLILFSLGVLGRAVADGGHRRLFQHARDALAGAARGRPARRMIGIWALLGGYIGLLSLHPFGRLSALLEGWRWAYSSPLHFLIEPEGINYVLSSFLFLGGFMLAFYRPESGALRWRHAAAILGLSLLVSCGIAYVFTEHLYAPLPWLDYGRQAPQ